MKKITKNPGCLSETPSPQTTEAGAEASPYYFHSMGSMSDRVNAARLMETLFTQNMGRPHKAELMTQQI